MTEKFLEITEQRKGEIALDLIRILVKTRQFSIENLERRLKDFSFTSGIDYDDLFSFVRFLYLDIGGKAFQLDMSVIEHLLAPDLRKQQEIAYAIIEELFHREGIRLGTELPRKINELHEKLGVIRKEDLWAFFHDLLKNHVPRELARQARIKVNKKK